MPNTLQLKPEQAAALALASALQFLRMSSGYFQEMCRNLGDTQYRRGKLDRHTVAYRNLFNDLIAPLPMDLRPKLQQDLNDCLTVEALISYAVVMNPEQRDRLETEAKKILIGTPEGKGLGL